jgi:hypothetical protein
MRVIATLNKFGYFKTTTIRNPFSQEKIFIWQVPTHLVPLENQEMFRFHPPAFAPGSTDIRNIISQDLFQL